jgi:hypothetical protein
MPCSVPPDVPGPGLRLGNWLVRPGVGPICLVWLLNNGQNYVSEAFGMISSCDEPGKKVIKEINFNFADIIVLVLLN